jgi:uncharacterized protein (TIGR02145 family)
VVKPYRAQWEKADLLAQLEEAKKRNTELLAQVEAAKSTFTDPRDGKVYRTVKIGNQIWMAENLNYDIKGLFGSKSKCYNNEPKNAEKYGRLYDWKTAMKVAPPGWHLPSNEEWDKLYRFADSTSGTESPYKSETAGKYLKAKSGWNYCRRQSDNGEDKFGFSALPVGYDKSGGRFYDVDSAYWWSSSELNSGVAYSRYMYYKYEEAGWGFGVKSSLRSVRCLQD